MCLDTTPACAFATASAALIASSTSATLPLNFTVTKSGTGKASALPGLFLSNTSNLTFAALHPASAARKAQTRPNTSNKPTAS